MRPDLLPDLLNQPMQWSQWTHQHPSRAALRLPGLLRLLRLSNSLSASSLVLIGARLSSGGEPPTAQVWLAAAAMWCITAFGYASNDLADLAEDHINKPDRPLPAGLVSVGAVRLLLIILAATGVGLAALLGWRELTIATAGLGLLLIYNARLKATPGAGNLLIALLAGSALLTGSVADQGFMLAAHLPILLPATLLVLLISARELVKTLEDLPGDRAVGKQTLAVVAGARAVLAVVGFCTLCAGGLAVGAWWWAGYSGIFLAWMLAGIFLPLTITIGYLWPAAPVKQTRQMLRLLKGSYFAGLAALWFV